jgi:hypothetical protein
MAERLDLLMDIPEDVFKQTYNTYQVPSQTVQSQRQYYIPALRARHDAIEINDFLVQQITHFPTQYSTEYVPQYTTSSNKALYPTLDVGYSSQPDMAPSTNLYPQLFDQTPLPSSAYVGMGSRMTYDQTRLVYAGTLQKAPPRAGSEELVDDMEKMDVDSESKEKKPSTEQVNVKAEGMEKDVKAKHLEVIKKLQKMVQEMILDWQDEADGKVKSESSVMEKAVPVEAQ